MINYQDSLQLQINSPLDAKVCNYYREAADFIIEPVAKYLERVIDTYRSVGAIVTVLEAKEGYTPVLDNGLIKFPLASFASELSNFDIKYYTFIDGIADVDFKKISFGSTYVAYASDSAGTGFSLTPSAGLNYIAILVVDDKIDTPQVADFVGLWHRPDQTKADWNEVDTSSPAYIENKPTIPAAQVQTDWSIDTPGDVRAILNKPTIPDAQIQSD
jgi:hypothetical protein